VMFKRGNREIGLGFESVIKASFVNTGALADVIDADRAITIFPDQLQSGLEELSFGIGFASHGTNLVDWLV